MKLAEAALAFGLLGTPAPTAPTPAPLRIAQIQAERIAEVTTPAKPAPIEVHRYLLRTDKDYQEKFFNLRIDIFKEAEKIGQLIKNIRSKNPPHNPGDVRISDLILDFTRFIVTAENEDFSIEEFQQYKEQAKQLQERLDRLWNGCYQHNPFVVCSWDTDEALLYTFFNQEHFIEKMEAAYGVHIRPLRVVTETTKDLVIQPIDLNKAVALLGELALRFDQEQLPQNLFSGLGVKEMVLAENILAKEADKYTSVGGSLANEKPSTIYIRYLGDRTIGVDDSDILFHEAAHTRQATHKLPSDAVNWMELHPGSWQIVPDATLHDTFQNNKNQYMRYFLNDHTPLYRGGLIAQEKPGIDYTSCNLETNLYGACGEPVIRIPEEDMAYTEQFLWHNLYQAELIYGKNPVLRKTMKFLMDKLIAATQDATYFDEKRQRDRLRYISNTLHMTPEMRAEALPFLHAERERIINLVRNYGGYIPFGYKTLFNMSTTEFDATQMCNADPDTVDDTCASMQIQRANVAFISSENEFWAKGLNAYAQYHAQNERLRGNTSFAERIPGIAAFRFF